MRLHAVRIPWRLMDDGTTAKVERWLGWLSTERGLVADLRDYRSNEYLRIEFKKREGARSSG